jgi:hypothetical protein
MDKETSMQNSARAFEYRIIDAFNAIGYAVDKPSKPSEFDFFIRRYEFPFEIKAIVEVKYFERSFVPASVVYRHLDMLQRYSVDKAIIVTTLGFSREGKSLAERSEGKIVLLTEAELIEKIPGRRMHEYYDSFLNSNYVLSSVREYFETTKPSYEDMISRIPRNRLCEFLSEFAPPKDLADFIAEKVPRERIVEQFEKSLEPSEVKEILVSRPKKIEIPISRKKEIEQTYEQARSSNDSNQKGKLFEKVMKGIFELVPDLKVVGSNVDDGIEEIDIQLRNYNHEHIWAELEGMIFVECKNWSKPVTSKEIDNFKAKLERNGLHTGILVAVMGVTGSGLSGGWGAIKMYLQNGWKIIVLDGKDLEDIFKCTDISEKIDDKYVHLYKIGNQKHQ